MNINPKTDDKKSLMLKGMSLMVINESKENYLESILIIKNRNGYVRSIDIAHELSFTKASVSVAMKAFREQDYITVDENGGIELTEKGLEIAERVYERHQIIAQALMALGVNETTAYSDSCKIEHDISEESFEAIKKHLSKYGADTQEKGDEQ